MWDFVASALEVADDNSELALWVKIFGADAGGASEVLWHQSWAISVSDSTVSVK